MRKPLGAVFLLFAVGRILEAQTSCSVEHSGPGVLICAPNPSVHPTDAPVPEYFHVSVQANAFSSHAIRHYAILLDGKLKLDSRLPIPYERLSIEVNLRSGLTSGAHTLRVIVDGAGIAEMRDLPFHTPAGPGFCDGAEGFLIGTCTPQRHGSKLAWSLPAAPPSKSDPLLRDPLLRYEEFRDLYRRNLKSFEADVADAVVMDPSGNLFVALHLLAGLEVRRYSPDGSVTYDTVLPSCKDASLAISRLAADRSGHLWIAGNTSAACFPTTASAWRKNVPDNKQTRGFVVLLDTLKPTSTAPLYATYLGDAESRISDLAVDADGNAYVVGTTSSSEFPHTSRIRVAQTGRTPSGRMGFVSVLKRDGSGLQWSTLIENTELRGVALDSTGKVFVTGGTTLAALSDDGKKLSCTAHFGKLGSWEGRSIAVAADGTRAFVSGETGTSNATRTFILGMKPCDAGTISTQLLAANNDADTSEIADRSALQAFLQDFGARETK